MLDRHSRAWRLLACTSAALACAAAYANAAQAGLEGLPGQQNPVSTTVGTANSTVSGVTATVSGTVETATSAAAPVSTVVEPTVSSATGALADATQTVSGTAQAASTTLDQTLATAESAVGNVVSTPTSTLTQAAPVVDSTTPASFTPPATIGSTGSSSAGSEPGVPGSDAAPAPDTRTEPAASFTRVDRGRAPPTTPSKPPASPAQRVAGARTAGRTGLESMSVSRSLHDGATFQRPSRLPAPNAPSSSTTLLGGAGASRWLVFAALLGALLLAAFGRPGSRLRPRSEIFRPPDVLFQLERPG